jgi:hypothetical protein
MNIQSKTGVDWCHLCGERKNSIFIELSFLFNAENPEMEGPGRFVRICKDCVRKISVEMVHTKVVEELHGKPPEYEY